MKNYKKLKASNKFDLENEKVVVFQKIGSGVPKPLTPTINTHIKINLENLAKKIISEKFNQLNHLK